MNNVLDLLLFLSYMYEVPNVFCNEIEYHPPVRGNSILVEVKFKRVIR